MRSLANPVRTDHRSGMKGAARIFEFLVAAQAAGERTALVTLTDVIGRSSREPGRHMAVSETGAACGSFSGGCVEAAIIAEAQAIIASGQAQSIRFGIGSRFIDIRLPCGGGIDLLFTPDPDLAVIRRAARRLASRQAVTLLLPKSGGVTIGDEQRTGWSPKGFAAAHDPELRLMIAGHGEEVGALARLALAYGAEVQVLSPDKAVLDSAISTAIPMTHLASPTDGAVLTADRFTAVILLFHDHEWETDLLIAAIGSEAFFVGAMGSRTTHAARAALLEAAGTAPDDIARIVAPVGAIPAVRDPDMLALSILAQVVETARNPTA